MRRVIRGDNWQSGFSLTELLTVIAIIVVLIGIALPAVRGLAQGNGARAAVATLLGVLDQARAQAIGTGRATYLVFAYDRSGSAGIPQEKFARACAIYQDADNVTFTPRQISNWQVLPTGISLKVQKATDDKGNSVPSLMNFDPTNPAPSIPDPKFSPPSGSTSPNAIALPFIKFDTTGAVERPDPEYLRLLLFDGFINPPNSEVSTRRLTNVAGDQYLVHEIRLNSTTGRARYTVNPADNLQSP